MYTLRHYTHQSLDTINQISILYTCYKPGGNRGDILAGHDDPGDNTNNENCEEIKTNETVTDSLATDQGGLKIKNVVFEFRFYSQK